MTGRAAAETFVDTNVLIYRRDRADPLKHKRASDWIELLWRSRSGRLSVQVLQEFYITVTQKLDPKMARETARQDVRDFMTWRPVPIDSTLVEAAWSIQDRHKLSWWDALIVAAAQRAGCRYLLTEDLQDGQTLDGLQIVNPFIHEPHLAVQPSE